MGSKVIKVKNSQIFDEQLRKLKESSRKSDDKFNKQLLKAIERETEILKSNPHRHTNP